MLLKQFWILRMWQEIQICVTPLWMHHHQFKSQQIGLYWLISAFCCLQNYCWIKENILTLTLNLHKVFFFSCINSKDASTVKPRFKSVPPQHNFEFRGHPLMTSEFFRWFWTPPPHFVRILFTKPYLLNSKFPKPPLPP